MSRAALLRWTIGCGAVLAIVPCAGGAADAGSGAADAPALFAERLEEANLERRLGGPDAIGGIGDWALGNGTLCAVVSDPAHESQLSPRGGVLVDLGHCGRRDDQWNVLESLLDLSRSRTVTADEIEAEVDGDEARIVTRGAQGGLAFETTHAVERRRPRVLRVTTRIRRIAEGDGIFAFGDVALHGHRQLSPFTLSLRHPERSVGFAHPDVDVDSVVSLARALVPADVHVLVGGHALEPGIAYGLELREARLETPDGDARPLPSLAINGESFSLLGVFSRPFWLGGDPVGWLELAQTPFLDLHVGESLVYERWLRIGDRADAASITDELWPAAPEITGRLDDREARIHVAREDGAPVTFARPEPDGRFHLRLPRGRYRLSLRAPGGRRAERGVSIEDEALDLGLLRIGAPAVLLLPRDAGPMRLVFRGQGGTPDPPLGGDLLGFRLGERSVPSSTLAPSVSLGGGAHDPEHVVLPPGRYRVYATRGPEFTVSEASVSLAPGETSRLEIAAPVRALESPGWLSADLHVHSQASHDSALPERERVRSFAAQGVEVVVESEHDRVGDWSTAIRALGLGDLVAQVKGVEVTSTYRGGETPYTFGHANVFPFPRQPDRYRQGAPPHEGRRLRRLIASVRALGGERVVQLNHPRRGTEPSDLYFFTHLSVAGEPFDPSRPLDRLPNRHLIEPEDGVRDLDFDAMELLNGARLDDYALTRRDWLALLRQGEVRTATANSDSHRLGQLVAMPRTYVGMADDTVAGFDVAAFVEAIQKGAVYGTTGPLLSVRLGGAGIGERFEGAEGTLVVGVRTAPWVPVQELRIYSNGELQEARPTSGNEVNEVPLRFAADAFVHVEVEGEAGPVYAAVAPGFRPLAFSNPVFVDADGDGVWSPPGLPRERSTLPW